MPVYDFIQFLGAHQISIFNYTEEEMRADLEAALGASGLSSERRKKD